MGKVGGVEEVTRARGRKGYIGKRNHGAIYLPIAWGGVIAPRKKDLIESPYSEVCDKYRICRAHR